MREFINQTYDQERALYALRDARVVKCLFAGPADGESALKESKRIVAEDCDFSLRYPLWHAEDAEIVRARMTETCRAAMWYDQRLTLRDCQINGIKALRECGEVVVRGGGAVSPEFGWMCRNVNVEDFTVVSEYPFFMTRGMEIDRLRLKGKYSFQYVRDAVIRFSTLDTKDAFWHTENVTVTDSVVKGEYLGWYSRNLRLVRCEISGTQPLCYCKGLELIDCVMTNADLAFENSEVEATVKGGIDSVKNPIAGHIRADSIGELILDEYLPKDATCVIDAPVTGAR